MDLELVKKIVVRQANNEFLKNPIELPPEAKVVTGKVKEDSYLHFLETKCGVEILLSGYHHEIVGYNVIDEKKFSWFVLRWS
jgi:D-aminopeptidase